MHDDRGSSWPLPSPPSILGRVECSIRIGDQDAGRLAITFPDSYPFEATPVFVVSVEKVFLSLREYSL